MISLEPFRQAAFTLRSLSPGMQAGLGVSALLAPWALRNEDRGYGRTALLTTPVLAAGFGVAPGIGGALRDAYASVRGQIAAAPFTWEGGKIRYSSLSSLEAARQRGVLPEEDFRRWAPLAREEERRRSRAFYSELRANRPAPGGHTVEAVQEQLSDRLRLLGETPEEIYANTAGRKDLERQLTHGLYEAKLKAFAPLDKKKIVYPNQPLSMSEIEAEIAQARGMAREQAQKFLGTLSHVITRSANRTVAEAVDPQLHTLGEHPFRRLQVRRPGTLRDYLVKANGEAVGDRMMGLLDDARRNGWVSNTHILLNEQKEAVGLSVSAKGAGSLTFGFYNQQTRQMRLGKNLEQVAVARQVWRPSGVERLDVHLLEHLEPAAGHEKNWFQQLRQELASHTLYAGHDPEDSAWVRSRQPDRASALLPEQAAQLHGGEIRASRLPLWNGKTWEKLDHGEQVARFEQLRGQAGKYGNEASLTHGVVNTIEQAQLAVGLTPSERKADATFRSLSKSLQIDPATVPAELKPTLVSDAVRQLYGGEVPAFSMKVGGLSPQLVSVARQLPADAEHAAAWDQAAEGVIESLRQDVLAANPQMAEEESRKWAMRGWKSLRANLEGNAPALAAVRKLGSAGETDFLLGREFRPIETREQAVANVKSFHIPGDTFTDRDVIGFTESGAAVQSSAPRNRITSRIYDQNSGQWKIHYERRYAMETGSKVDALGHKGLAVLLEGGERETIVQTLNHLYGSMGQGTPYARDLNAFTNALYFQSSLKEEPLAAILGNTNELLERLPSLPGGDALAREYADKFVDHHIYAGEQAFEDSARATTALDRQAAAQGVSLGAAKAERLEALNQLSHEVFDKAGVLIQQNSQQAAGDSLFSGYLYSNESNLRTYMERYYQRAGQAFSWDNTRRDMPRQVSVTYDMYGHLARAGETGALTELLQNAKTQHGDTAQAFDYAEHLFSPESFQKPLGEVVPLAELEDASRPLSDVLFDPTQEVFQKNFSLDLGKDHTFQLGKEKVTGRYLPMLGLEGYKALPNEFGTGETSLSESQRALTKLVQHLQGGRSDQTAELSHAFFDARLGELFGKGGILRPEAVAPHAVSAAIQTRGAPSTFGRENPFDVVLSPDAVAKLGDRKLRQTLQEGGHAYAKIARHPISAMPSVKVRMGTEADHLGPNMMGVSERLRSMLNSDDDKDVASLLFFRSSAARAEARRALRYESDFSKKSLQWKNHRLVELLQGNAEDSGKVSGAAFEEEFASHSLDQMVGKLADLSRAGTYDNIPTRLAHAETGKYSNLLTRLHLNLEGHAGLAERVSDRSALEQLFFQVRQVPISAGKGKMKLAGTPDYLHNLLSAGLDNLDPEHGFAQAQDALTKVWMGTGKNIRINSPEDLRDIGELFGVTHRTLDYDRFTKLATPQALAVGSGVNVGAETLQQGKGADLLREFITGRNRSADKAMGGLVDPAMNAEKARRLLQNLDTTPEYLTGFQTGRDSSRMANRVSETLGAINEALKENVGNLRKAFKPALPILGIGLGVAAAAGILGTKLASGHRPEETAGVSDQHPEQAVEGSMSMRPRVVETPAPMQTPTVVVAPMATNNHIEVTASAPSRSEAAERSRIVSKLKNANGHTSMTVNYQGSWNSAASSLRRKQQLREQLDLTS